MSSLLKKFKTDLLLFLQTPVDYLYSFRYSDDNSVVINPYDPNSFIIAQEFMKKIKKKCPALCLYLIGSTGLQIAGRGDVDLYATTLCSEFPEIVPKISKIFGEPAKIRKKFIEWKTVHNGQAVELTLTDPKNKHFQMQIKLFDLLKNNKDYLNEYRKLKSDLCGCSEKEYVRKRMEFFNRILISS